MFEVNQKKQLETILSQFEILVLLVHYDASILAV